MNDLYQYILFNLPVYYFQEQQVRDLFTSLPNFKMIDCTKADNTTALPRLNHNLNNLPVAITKCYRNICLR